MIKDTDEGRGLHTNVIILNICLHLFLKSVLYKSPTCKEWKKIGIIIKITFSNFLEALAQDMHSKGSSGVLGLSMGKAGTQHI